jgi:hypothetical protein
LRAPGLLGHIGIWSLTGAERAAESVHANRVPPSARGDLDSLCMRRPTPGLHPLRGSREFVQDRRWPRSEGRANACPRAFTRGSLSEAASELGPAALTLSLSHPGVGEGTLHGAAGTPAICRNRRHTTRRKFVEILGSWPKHPTESAGCRKTPYRGGILSAPSSP